MSNETIYCPTETEFNHIFNYFLLVLHASALKHGNKQIGKWISKFSKYNIHDSCAVFLCSILSKGDDEQMQWVNGLHKFR